MRAEIGSPWPAVQQATFPPRLEFKLWASPGKIIAVWQSNDPAPDSPTPVVRVFQAATGGLEQQISPAEGVYDDLAPWERMSGQFRIEMYALAQSQNLLAMAAVDLDRFDRTLLWIVDFLSGTASS